MRAQPPNPTQLTDWYWHEGGGSDGGVPGCLGMEAGVYVRVSYDGEAYESWPLVG